MLRDIKTNKIRLANDQLGRIKKKAAENNYVVGSVTSDDEALDACIKAMPESEVERILAFMAQSLGK